MIAVIVDDERTFAAALAPCLERRGIEVFTVDVAHDVSEVCQRVRPDVLIVELLMDGGVTGFELVDAVHGHGVFPHVILVCGFPYPELQSSARERGIGHFLAKPIERVELDAVLDQLAAAPAPGRLAPGKADPGAGPLPFSDDS